MHYMDMPSAEDYAYESARRSFEGRRERIMDEAVDAHERGDEDRAQELLAQARAMVFRGLVDY